MNLLFSNSKPIVACSSGLESRSAISIIRVSGFSDLVKLNDFFDIDCSDLKPRYSHLAHVKDGEEDKNNNNNPIGICGLQKGE